MASKKKPGGLPAKIGRPKGTSPYYCDAVADEICERLSEGETLVSICKYDRDGNAREPRTFPSFAAVHDWADPKDRRYVPSFGPRFARARLDQQRYLLEEIVDLSRGQEMALEESIEDEIAFAPDGSEVVVARKRKRSRKDEIRRTNMRIQTNINFLSRINPQLWEARLQQPAPAPETTANEAPRMIIEGGLPDDDPAPPADVEPKGEGAE